MEGELSGDHTLALACRQPNNNQLTSFIMGRTICGEAETLKIATNPTDRGQRAACALISATIQLLKRKNVRTCRLELRATNHPGPAPLRKI